MTLIEQIEAQRAELLVLHWMLDDLRKTKIEDEMVKNLSALTFEEVIILASIEKPSAHECSILRQYFQSLEVMALIAPISVDLDSIFHLLPSKQF